jgi:hypothetical protein
VLEKETRFLFVVVWIGLALIDLMFDP